MVKIGFIEYFFTIFGEGQKMWRNIQPFLKLLSNVRSKWDIFFKFLCTSHIIWSLLAMKNNKNVPFYSILFRLTHQGKMPNSEKKILKSMDHHFPLSDKSFVISSTFMRFWKRHQEYYETPSVCTNYICCGWNREEYQPGC